jgi:serine/threonine-protein kinase RsbT
MLGPEATNEVIGALKGYFSESIAKVLLASTLRRANLRDAPRGEAGLPEAIDALERVLPTYIVDEQRRAECVSRLRGLAPPYRGSIVPRAARRALSIASTAVRVATSEDLSNAREVGRDIATRMGFSALDQMKISTAISELARNILQYASAGEVTLAGIVAPRRGIEIVANDNGPGIADVAAVLSPSFRSATGMGMGLKGTRRLMDLFEVQSRVGIGTTVLARKYVA